MLRNDIFSFVEALKRVHEDVNLKIEELHSEMTKEVAKVDHNYSNLHKIITCLTIVVQQMKDSFQIILVPDYTGQR